MLEKIIRDNDTYFLEILENKIIINDNYHGILIFDLEMNFKKAINLLSKAEGVILKTAPSALLI